MSNVSTSNSPPRSMMMLKAVSIVPESMM